MTQPVFFVVWPGFSEPPGATSRARAWEGTSSSEGATNGKLPELSPTWDVSPSQMQSPDSWSSKSVQVVHTIATKWEVGADRRVDVVSVQRLRWDVGVMTLASGVRVDDKSLENSGWDPRARVADAGSGVCLRDVSNAHRSGGMRRRMSP